MQIPKFQPLNHPCPQMRRDRWRDLNGEWKFTFDDEYKYFRPSQISNWTHKINVPFCPESKASGVEDNSFHTNYWYERDFNLPFDLNGGKVLLRCNAIDYSSKIWVNDCFVGEHEGGYTPIKLDITHALTGSSNQKLSIWAQDDPHDLAKPRGKQDWLEKPHSIWYPRTSGIWQSVWLEFVPNRYIQQIRWTPSFERWEIRFEGFVEGGHCEDLQMKIELSHKGTLLARDIYDVVNCEVHRGIALSDPGIDDYRNELLWSPDKPQLIDAKVELLMNDEVVDTVYSYTAMRSVDVNRDRFMLNGRPYYLRLVLDQGYWPDTLITPPSEEAVYKDIMLVKRMGFNGVRKHQKIEDTRFLYWADKLGLLVWEEMPSPYRFTEKTVSRLTKEWIEVMQRDWSHPCIVVWVPFNESWGVPNLVESAPHQSFVQALYHLTKSLDPSRPAIGNDGWESTDTDIIGIHDYDNNPERLQKRYGPEVNLNDLFNLRRPGGRILTLEGHPHKGQPIMLTEFGGMAFQEKAESGVPTIWGYATAHTAESFAQNYSCLLAAVHRVSIFSGFCYTQFTDTFQEANGLLYADRTPKVDLEIIAKATIGEPIACEMQFSHQVPYSPYEKGNTYDLRSSALYNQSSS